MPPRAREPTPKATLCCRAYWLRPAPVPVTYTRCAPPICRLATHICDVQFTHPPPHDRRHPFTFSLKRYASTFIFPWRSPLPILAFTHLPPGIALRASVGDSNTGYSALSSLLAFFVAFCGKPLTESGTYTLLHSKARGPFTTWLVILYLPHSWADIPTPVFHQ